MTERETYYKVTDTGGQPFHGGTGKWTKGRWRSVKGEIVACHNGLHFCTIDQLPQWLGPEVWEFEPSGEIIDAGDKLVCAKGRITRKIETWNETAARLFAADCAEHVLPLFEKHYPKDDRPRKAIDAARQFARGEISRDDMAAAGAAAWAAGAAAWAAAWAAGNAAGAAARDAAWAAGNAARDAAGAAAWAAGNAAGAAAWAAAWAAGNAARDAARDAAGAAAWAAAWDARAAARDAEIKWQGERLRQYLDGELA
jgi:hypothetical protein